MIVSGHAVACWSLHHASYVIDVYAAMIHMSFLMSCHLISRWSPRPRSFLLLLLHDHVVLPRHERGRGDRAEPIRG